LQLLLHEIKQEQFYQNTQQMKTGQNKVETLFNNLMKLSKDDNTPFYHSLQTYGDDYYLIFNYHFTDKDSWLLEDALESRGIMFEVTRDAKFIRIASRPMQKFFNKGEVDFIEYSKPAYVMDKVDGSLISSWKDATGKLQVKSKGSLYSDHAIAAQEFLDEPGNAMMKTFLYRMEDEGYTVNMEWTSPDPKFRIVLHYEKPALIILNARHRETGEYYNQVELHDRMHSRMVELYLSNDILNDLEDQTGIEGYVVIDDKNNWYKLKTPWYLERHRAKDFINQPYAFVNLVLKEEADDVLGLVADQPPLHEEMIALQHMIVTKANHFVNIVTKYYKENKDLSRKDYAIKAQEELVGFEFPLAMQYYVNESEPDWKGFLLQVSKKINWGFDDVTK